MDDKTRKELKRQQDDGDEMDERPIITVDELIKVCATKVQIRISLEQALKMLAENEDRTNPLTALQMAQNLFLEMECQIADEVLEQREMDDLLPDGFEAEMDPVYDPYY